MSASGLLTLSSNNNIYRSANNIKAWKYDKNNRSLHPSKDDSILNANTNPLGAPQLIKSNSYSGTVTDCVLNAFANSSSSNGAEVDGASVAISEHERRYSGDIDVSGREASSADGTTSSAANANEDSNEYDAFLINSAAASSPRRSARSYLLSSKTRGFITRNWYLSYLVPICILIAVLIVAYLTRDYAKQLLFWIETQNPWMMFLIFMALFTLVSFPIVVGYFVLLITAGYLFGCWKGWLTVILGANLGIAIAHATIRSSRHWIPMQKLIKNETGRAILRVISGPKAFKVVLFTRLTPIPFGLQNVIFGISSINARVYHAATFLGLLPAQTINVYLGSTLRSMHEVLNDKTKLTGYISFVFEVMCGVALMFWVVQKARKELSETLLAHCCNESQHLDMQV